MASRKKAVRRRTTDHAGGRGSVFRAFIWFKMNASEPSSGFSLPPDDDEEFRGGRGKRVNRPSNSNPRLPTAKISTRIVNRVQTARQIGRRQSLQKRSCLGKCLRTKLRNRPAADCASAERADRGPSNKTSRA